MKSENNLKIRIHRPVTLSEIRVLLERPETERDIENTVRKIVRNVKLNGDKALSEYSQKFDGVVPESFEVSETEIDGASDRVSPRLKRALRTARENIESFHKKSVLKTFRVIETVKGVRCWQNCVPIEKVGLYIPGGSAPLISTVLMLGVPAILAGCREIFITTPPDRSGHVHPSILYTASMLGIKKVYASGGAQGIAAMAFGTETFPKADKIFGPGNAWVTKAKQLVFLEGTAIDMPAGPSELMILADSTAEPEFLAADLLSQAEHGVDSQVILISCSEDILNRTIREIFLQLNELDRKNIAEAALENCRFILLRDREKIFHAINDYAPEHLIIATNSSMEDSCKVFNAGSVFLGNFTPESAGDYASGPNHTLPTGGWSRTISGLSVDSFRKTISFQRIDENGIELIGPMVEDLAMAEGMDGHANAVSVRRERIIRRRGSL